MEDECDLVVTHLIMHNWSIKTKIIVDIIVIRLVLPIYVPNGTTFGKSRLGGLLSPQRYDAQIFCKM